MNRNATAPSQAPPQTQLPPLNLFIDGLERMLRAQLEGHQRLLTCIEAKRQAIRIADMQSITDICAQEHSIVHRLAEIEKHRLELIGRLTEALNPAALQPITVSEIAASVDEPQRTRLIAVAAQLRDALMVVKRESSIIRAASEALSRHMSGIVQTVHSALSKARIYGSRGKIDLGVQVVSVVDLKS